MATELDEVVTAVNTNLNDDAVEGGETAESHDFDFLWIVAFFGEHVWPKRREAQISEWYYNIYNGLYEPKTMTWGSVERYYCIYNGLSDWKTMTGKLYYNKGLSDWKTIARGERYYYNGLPYYKTIATFAEGR